MTLPSPGKVSHWLALLGIVLVGAALLFAGRHAVPPGQTPTPSPTTAMPRAQTPASRVAPSSGANVAVASDTDVAGSSVAAILAQSRSLAAGLDRAIAVFGAKDPDVMSAVFLAIANCSRLTETENLSDPQSGLTGEWKDPRRTWAMAELAKACEDLDIARLSSQIDRSQVEDPLAALLKGGPKAQLKSARSVIARSRDSFALGNAGRAMILDDEQFVHDVFAGDPPVGRDYLAADWIYASSLATCSTQLGCGPGSVSTLAFCMEEGCERGVGLQQAMAASLPPREFQAVMSFHDWIQRR